MSAMDDDGSPLSKPVRLSKFRARLGRIDLRRQAAAPL
jgi:hypothetical protein